MKKILLKVFIICFSISLLSVLAEAKPKLVRRTANKQPTWITMPMEDADNLYFVGSKQNVPTLAEGMEGAIQRALEDLFKYIGVTMATRSEITQRVQENKEFTEALDKIKTAGEAKIKGQRLKEVYYEEYSDDGKRFYDVFVLLKYSKREVKTERERIETEQQKNRELAKQYLEDAKKFLAEGKVWDTYLKYADALKIVVMQGSSPIFYESLTGIKKIVEGLSFETVAKDKNGVKVKIKYTVGDKVLPVAGLNLKSSFVFGTGEVSGMVNTDDKGVAELKIAKISFKDGIAKIHTAIDANQFILPIKDSFINEDELKNIQDLLAAKNTNIVLKISDFSVGSVGILIWDKTEKRNYELEGIFGEKLTASGYKIVSPKNVGQITFADYETDEFYSIMQKNGINMVVLGRTSVTDQGEVYGMRSALTKVDIRIIDVKKKEMLNTFTQSKAGVGLSVEQASAKSYQSLVDVIIQPVIDLLSMQ